MTSDGRELTTKALVAARKALRGHRSGSYPSDTEAERVLDLIEAALLSNFLTSEGD